MEEKRIPLDRDSRKIMEIQLKRQEALIENLENNLKLADFRLDFEIDFNASNEKKRFIDIKKKILENKEFVEKKIGFMKDQLENGVVPKNKTIETVDDQSENEVEEQ